MNMNFLDRLMMVLLVVGGLNWGLVGVAKFDLVATLVGKSFGEVNVVSQVVYTLVGVAAIYIAARSMKKPQQA